MTFRFLFYLIVAAASAALVLNTDEPERPASRPIDDQPILFRIKGSTPPPQRSQSISDPIPIEEPGRENWPDVVLIGDTIDADGPVAESADAPNPLPIEIGRILDANETDVWYLPRTSTAVIEIGTPLDADSSWPDQNQEREPVDIGPPIEAEGFGSLL